MPAARITAVKSIVTISTSLRPFCSCFRVLMNAPCVSPTASTGSSVNREATAIDPGIVAADQRFKASAFVSFRWLWSLLSCRRSRERGASPRPLGGFHLSPCYTGNAEGSSPHNVFSNGAVNRQMSERAKEPSPIMLPNTQSVGPLIAAQGRTIWVVDAIAKESVSLCGQMRS